MARINPFIWVLEAKLFNFVFNLKASFVSIFGHGGEPLKARERENVQQDSANHNTSFHLKGDYTVSRPKPTNRRLELNKIRILRIFSLSLSA